MLTVLFSFASLCSFRCSLPGNPLIVELTRIVHHGQCGLIISLPD